MWFCLKPIRVRRGGELKLLAPGDLIPEASTWHNADMWKRRGYIREIPRAEDIAAASVGVVIKEAEVIRSKKSHKKKKPAPQAEPVETSFSIFPNAEPEKDPE